MKSMSNVQAVSAPPAPVAFPCLCSINLDFCFVLFQIEERNFGSSLLRLTHLIHELRSIGHFFLCRHVDDEEVEGVLVLLVLFIHIKLGHWGMGNMGLT
jgi:hypothetical protein